MPTANFFSCEGHRWRIGNALPFRRSFLSQARKCKKRGEGSPIEEIEPRGQGQMSLAPFSPSRIVDPLAGVRGPKSAPIKGELPPESPTALRLTVRGVPKVAGRPMASGGNRWGLEHRIAMCVVCHCC